MTPSFTHVLCAAWLLALVWSPTSAHAEESPQSKSSFRHHMVQGRFLLEEGRAAQALAEFKAAADMPEAGREAELHYLMSQSYWSMDRVGEAVAAIETAHDIAVPQGRVTDEMSRLKDFLVATFSRVTVVGAGPGARLPEPVVPILDPAQKRLFEAVLEHLQVAADIDTMQVFLPVGAYRLGGHIVELKAGRTTRLDLRATTGRTASGVYGEGRSLGPPVGMGSLMLQVGMSGFYQQGEGGAEGRFQVGWMCRFLQGRLAVRFAGVVSMSPLERLERLESADVAKSPLGFGGGIQLGVGPVFRLASRVTLTPWFAWNIGYGHPIDVALPPGYQGPVHYLLHGPDVELLFGFEPARTAPDMTAVTVQPVFGLRVLLREARPLALAESDDRRPHLAVGGGVEFGLRIGG